MTEPQSGDAGNDTTSTSWRARWRHWRLRIKLLVISHAKQIISAAVVAIGAGIISTYVLTQMGIEDDDALTQAVAGLSGEQSAVQDVYVLRAKLAQVASLMTLPRMEITQHFQMSGKLPTSSADLDLSIYDLSEHALIDDVGYTAEGKLKVSLAADFGDGIYMLLWPKASSNGAFLTWRCETNLAEKYLGAAGMRACEPAS